MQIRSQPEWSKLRVFRKIHDQKVTEMVIKIHFLNISLVPRFQIHSDVFFLKKPG